MAQGIPQWLLDIIYTFHIIFFYSFPLVLMPQNIQWSQMSWMENRTEVSYFFLLGLTNAPDLELPLFIIFLLIYTITIVGNLGMILLIILDSQLHIPMYLFLGNLSLVDFCYSSAVTPTVMTGLLRGRKVMSYNDCATQMFCFTAFASVENYLLASMAYDRYAAVSKPLHYSTTMTPSVCAWLVIGCYILGFLNASIYTGDTFSLSFCESNVVHHFFVIFLQLWFFFARIDILTSCFLFM